MDSSVACQSKLETIAKSISLQLGMPKIYADMLGNPTEINGNKVSIYVGSRASYDYFEFIVKDLAGCQVSQLNVSKAE